jgi:hypothetical protein
MKILIYLFTISLLLVNCATVKITKLEKDQKYEEGLRFYRPAYYLMVYEDEKGRIKNTILTLPDKSQEYVIRYTPGLGSADIKATLEGGWNLTQYGTTLDSKVPETISSVSGLITALAGSQKSDDDADKSKIKGKPAIQTGLYRINFGDDGQVSNITRVEIRS